jgi:hypothetical protein
MWALVILIAVVASRVRGPDLPSSQEVCLNYFFTHLSIGALGVAFQPSVGGSGGICDTGMYVATLHSRGR